MTFAPEEQVRCELCGKLYKSQRMLLRHKCKKTVEEPDDAPEMLSDGNDPADTYDPERDEP